MIRLKDFINEQLNESKSQTFTFDFNGVDNCEELIKSLEGNELASIDNNVISINLTENNYTKLASVIDIIEQAIKAQQNGTKTTNNEQYAQKIKSLDTNLNKLQSAIDKYTEDNSKEETPDPKEEADKDADDNDDKKDE